MILIIDQKIYKRLYLFDSCVVLLKCCLIEEAKNSLLLCWCVSFFSLVQGILWFNASSNVIELRNHIICILDYPTVSINLCLTCK